MSSSLFDPAAYKTSNGYAPAGVMIIACSTLAIYNAVELLILISSTFKKRQGLYFWSISLASFGAIPYSVGVLTEHFHPNHAWAGMTVDAVGWILLVTGQSMVLYSRLHLVLHHALLLRLVFWMIVINGVTWHTTNTILVFGSKYSPEPSRANFVAVFNVLEKVQMTCFCLQEFIISGLYLWGITDILKTAFGNARNYMWRLFLVNVVVVVMDIGLLVIEYKGLWKWQQGIKVAVYTIKLKLEFAVLGELVNFVRHRAGTNSGDDPNTAEFVRIPPDRAHAHSKNDHLTTIPELTEGVGGKKGKDKPTSSTDIPFVSARQRNNISLTET